MENWHVLYTKPHCENQVTGALTAAGIETYLPVMPVVSPRRGRAAVRPFFPCYLFAHVDLKQVGVSRLNWMPGMRHLVTFGGVAARVDQSIIIGIRDHLTQPHVMDVHGEVLERGDHVVITTGPMQGIEALFNRQLSAAGRVQVLIQVLERWTACEIDAIAVRKLGKLDS
jgi:transcriptional antiterminator RfaH